MKAIILAAGIGRRMQPLSSERHKTLLDIDGRSIMGRIIDGLIANGIDEIVRHYQDPSVTEKGSTITLTITVTPDEARRKFGFDLSIGNKLSPRKGFSTDIYAGVDPDTDRVKAVEWDPQQLRMFDGPTPV